MDQLISKIKQWAKERGLLKGDYHKQTIKLGEEYGELCQGICKGNREQVIDSIGDMVVVLTILAEQYGTSIEECTSSAYKEIADRKGEMVNGVFVKESDLRE